MSFPCQACEKEGRTCHVDVHCDGCFECAHRGLACHLGAKLHEIGRLERSLLKLELQMGEVQDERTRQLDLAPKVLIQRWNKMMDRFHNGSIEQAPPSQDRAAANLREMLAMAEFQVIEPYLHSDYRHHRLVIQRNLAHERFREASEREDKYLDALVAVEDDMQEVLGVKGFDEFRESKLSDLYWDPLKKRLVSVNEDEMEVDVERLTVLK